MGNWNFIIDTAVFALHEAMYYVWMIYTAVVRLRADDTDVIWEQIDKCVFFLVPSSLSVREFRRFMNIKTVYMCTAHVCSINHSRCLVKS